MRISSGRCGTVLVVGFILAGFHRGSAASDAATGVVNQIDQIVLSVAKNQSIEPTALCDDDAFLRRVTVDLIGRIPTAEEYEVYWKLPDAERRAAWVTRLLADPRFADRWTVFFGDMFRIRSGAEGGQALGEFVRQSVAAGKPYDLMVREMITSVGTYRTSSAVGFLTSDGVDPFELTGVTSQVFLGIRLKCAQCHDHPFDKWSREDYYGLAAFFGKTTSYRRGKQQQITVVTESPASRVLWPPTAEDGEAQKPMQPTWPFAMQSSDASDRHIKALLAKRAAKKPEQPKGPSLDELLARADRRAAAAGNRPASRKGDDGETLADEIERERKRAGEDMDRVLPSPNREKLAELLTHPRNRYFAWNLVNRVWAELIGHGIVMPVDDFRDGNEPSHPGLLDHLADEFIASGYDLRALVELIVTSQTYQRAHLLGAKADDREQAEELFCAAPLRRMNAEVLYDSIVTAGHLSQFKHPAGKNVRETSVTVAIPKTAAKPADAGIVASLGGGSNDKSMQMASAKPRVIKRYSVEEAIEAAPELSPADEAMLALDRMEVESNDAIKARAMQRDQPAMEFDYKTVKQTYDDNPRFESALAMPAPAPPEHFLRQFGQTERTGLGEKRESSSNMRQALILLNGRLANEASRVGELEPIGPLLDAKKPIEPAILHAYIEILTRPPTSAELADAVLLVKSAESREAGIADLRWALLNCHEFRFLP